MKARRRHDEYPLMVTPELMNPPSEACDAAPASAVEHATDEAERRVARQIEQLRACAGDYRAFSAARVQRWLAW